MLAKFKDGIAVCSFISVVIMLIITITFSILIIPLATGIDSINDCYPFKRDDCTQEINTNLNYVLGPDWIITIVFIAIASIGSGVILS